MTDSNRRAAAAGLDLSRVPSPSYVCDLGLLRENLEILKAVQDRSGCTILLALKGFAMFSVFPIVREYLSGASASSLNEARLARDEMGGEVHVYSPAYVPTEFAQLLEIVDTVVFNSWNEWDRYVPAARRASRRINCGVRVNPRYSEIAVALYDPCARFSRLGIPPEEFQSAVRVGLDGIHFHTHCEQNADVLARTLDVVEQHFGRYLGDLEWVNFGGGHHITRSDYDTDHLCRLVSAFRDRYGVRVYLEPGEAVALGVGVLVATVLDIVENEMPTAILDTSATAHMPDVLEMPYRPEIVGAGAPGEHRHTYRLGGLTCLAGDVIGDYSFPEPLKVGSRLVFRDMAHYTMVKNTTFNGVGLPAIVLYEPRSGDHRVVREFGYDDYKTRLS